MRTRPRAAPSPCPCGDPPGGPVRLVGGAAARGVPGSRAGLLWVCTHGRLSRPQAGRPPHTCPEPSRGGVATPPSGHPGFFVHLRVQTQVKGGLTRADPSGSRAGRPLWVGTLPLQPRFLFNGVFTQNPVQFTSRAWPWGARSQLRGVHLCLLPRAARAGYSGPPRASVYPSVK